jgi:hypothetical protein
VRGHHLHPDRQRLPLPRGDYNGRRVHLDGRPRSLDGQRVRRAAIALAQAQGHLLKGYSDGREAHAALTCWFAFYDQPQ